MNYWIKHLRRISLQRRHGAAIGVLLTAAAVAMGLYSSAFATLFSMEGAYMYATQFGTTTAGKPALGNEGAMPDLDGATGWLNSGPLNTKALRGKIVLVNFWTYTCINSLRPMPYVKSWAAKY